MDKFDSWVKALVALSFVLLGASFGLAGNDKALSAILAFYHVADWVELEVARFAAVAIFVLLAIGCVVPLQRTNVRWVATLMVGFALLPLITLLSPTRWIADLGGFPAIGSGQGIIKYYALIPLAFYFFAKNQFSTSFHALFNASSIALVLFWIGGMKFTAFEAKGIEALLTTSPFLSWLYRFFDVQSASNLIGVYDLAFAALLLFGLIYRKLIVATIGLAGASCVFIVTQSFLVSFPGALSATTLLSGTGQFLIKDLWFIANALIVAAYLLQQWQAIKPHRSQ